MTWIVTLALRLRTIVLGLALATVVAGIHAAYTVPQDVFPEFAPPLVEIQTEAPGLSTEEVEALVTVPLESALNGTPWLATLRSKSVAGLSSVVMLFADATDVLAARQLVYERLGAAAADLPTVARPPRMLPPLSATSRVLALGISSPSRSLTDLSELVRWTLRPRLLAVPGVANLAVFGEERRQVQVIVEPDRLQANGLTLDDVVLTATDAAFLRAGGFVDTPTQRIAVRQWAATSAVEVAATAVAGSPGTPRRLGDVVTVRDGSVLPVGAGTVGSGPGLFVVVEKNPWSNVLDVTHALEAALDALRPSLGDVRIDAVFRPATFVERSLHNLGRTALVGCALVACVLIAFLLDWRTASISVLAIPLSLLGAVLCLRALGQSMNVMVLAGLTIAVGEVVDDAIVDVENIVRRLRANRAAPVPAPTLGVVLRASTEVRSAIVYATVIVTLVFVPVLFLPGLAGAFFRPLALAYVLAVACSLLVALTVTPALAYVLLADRAHAPTQAGLVPALERRYAAVLARVLRRPRAVATVLAATIVFTLVAVPFLGEEFLPDFQENDFLMHWIGTPGTSLVAMHRTAARAGGELGAVPGVLAVGAHIGRAEGGDEVVGANFAELWLRTANDADLPAVRSQVQEIVDGHPGIQRDVLTYLRERVKEVLTGAKASVVVRIYGPDLDGLRAQADGVRDVLRDVPGVHDLLVEQQTRVPQLDVRLRPEAAAIAGVTPGQVRRAVATMVAGAQVGELYDGDRSAGLVVWGVPEARGDSTALRRLPIAAPGGAQTRLGDVAEVRLVSAPNEIRREGGSRRIDVLCNVRGRDIGGVARDVAERVRRFTFAPGYHAELLGEHAARTAARNRLAILGLFSLAAIALVVHADFQSLRWTGLVLLTLPFALVGGVAAAVLAGGVLSLGSLVGFVTVIGIAARNGIMLVSHYRHLLVEDRVLFGPETALRGATERLIPILMTALCAALALVPLVAAGNIAGHEIEYPTAVVILGGLVTSTLLNLFIVPTLFLAFGANRPERVSSDA